MARFRVDEGLDRNNGTSGGDGVRDGVANLSKVDEGGVLGVRRVSSGEIEERGREAGKQSKGQRLWSSRTSETS